MEITNLMVDGSLIPHEVVRMPADGSCMFHSIAYSLYNCINLQNSCEIRQNIVNYVTQNWSEYGPWSCNASGDTFKSVDEYRTIMLKSSAYGSLCEIKAAGEIYPVRFEVYANGELQGRFGSEANSTKRLLFSGNFLSGHYDVCVPLTQHLNNMTQEVNENNIRKKSKRGRPKKHIGKPKNSSTSRREQLRQASQRYRRRKLTQAQHKSVHPQLNESNIQFTSRREQLRQASQRYRQNHPQRRKMSQVKYKSMNPQINQLNRQAVARYSPKHPEVHRKAVAQYCYRNPKIHQEAATRYAKRHPQLSTRLKQQYYFRKFLNYTGSIEKITEKLSVEIGNRLEAEKIIKWVLQRRKYLLNDYLKTQEHLHKKIIKGLEKLKILSSDCDLFDKFQALAGRSLHRPTQEPYFSETCYKLLINKDPIILDNEGKTILDNQSKIVLGKNENNSWPCNFNICLLDDSVFLNLKETFDFISKYSPVMFYKILVKYDESYRNYLNILNSIKPHFPEIRSVVRRLYQMANDCNKITEIDKFLDDVNPEKLKELGDPSNIIAHLKHYKAEFKTVQINLDEDKIIEKYKSAFNILKRRCLDTPKNECISCERLLCLKDVSSLSRLKKPIETEIWSQLQKYIKNYNIRPSTFICHKCLQKIRANELPANCLLNGLYASPVPEEISTLNDFEKILIQRAKAFQVVSSMIPVGNRNIPNRQVIKKVKGRTFHLPLPLEATLQKLPKPEAPLNTSHELYILVRSNPTKEKIMWEDLVDVNKVFRALNFLKHNNEHYSNIILPQNPKQLLDGFDEELQYEGTESERITCIHEIINGVKEIENRNGNRSEQITSALLTQITEENQHEYEQYTIYPLHERRSNATASFLYQMLKVNDAPLDNRDKDIDVRCFPDVYVEGKYGQFYPRKKKLTSAEYIKCRLTSSHAQFRRNQQYIFFLLNDSNIRQLRSGIYYKLNVTKQKEQLTAETYLEMLQKDQLEGELTAIFSRLRNTEQYWKKPRSDIGCMTRHYGPATWFLTISPSEWTWTDLADYIKEINQLKHSKKPVSELVALDPVATSRFMNIQLKGILDFITSSAEPLGKVEHYFWRREYQSRGLQHFHMMLWIKDAPILQDSTTDEVAEFITKYVTCAIPDKKISPTLYDRVTKYQTHKHNSYCLRRKKTKTGFKMVCRFGFPRPVTDKINIKSVTESVVGRKKLSHNSRLYNIPREEESSFINDYNPAVLMAWNGNIDIQYVGEKTAVLNYYVTKYTTKGEKSSTIDVFNNVNSTKSLASRLYNVGLRALNNRECGILEACDTLLGLPLSGTDPETTIRWLDINMLRSRRIKSKQEINNLDPDSTDIFYESWVDNYYPQRPQELETTNLYEFSRWFDIVNSRPTSDRTIFYQISSKKYLKKRQRPYVINHYIYDANKFPEKYYFSILLMFKPWRDLEELKAGKLTYTEAFHFLKDTIKDGLYYEEQQNKFFGNLEKAFELIEAKISEIEEIRQCNEIDEGPENLLDFEPIEARNAMKEFKIAIEEVSDEEMTNMISQLNEDQKRIFDLVTGKVSNVNGILRLFVSGTGGTGKSYLITAIKKWVKKSTGKNVAVTAPTGIAAFNVNGLTIHRLLQLPVEHGPTPKYKPLSDQVLKVLRAEFTDVTLLIIDEVSMISNLTLMYIHLRLTEIYDTSESDDGWFGGRHILVFGDLLQLPPVRENSSFEDLSPSDVKKFLGSLSAPNLWKELFIYDELTINMRQKDDTTFINLLSCVRLGVITKQHYRLLLKRMIKFESKSNDSRLRELINYILELPENTVCLLPTKSMCAQLNNAMLNNTAGCKVQLIANDEIECPRFLNKKARETLDRYEDDSSMTAGLEKIITVKVGVRVMLRRNIDVTLGLVNGSIGTIKEIVRDINVRNKINKLKTLFNHGLEYELQRVKTKFEVLNRAYVYREQFPICIAYAITVHKSQGLSLDSAVLDIGSSIFSCGQAYVALSRVKHLEGIHLINFDPTQIKAQESAVLEYNRLRSTFRKDLELLIYQRNKINKNSDRHWALQADVVKVQASGMNSVKRKKTSSEKYKKKK